MVPTQVVRRLCSSVLAVRLWSSPVPPDDEDDEVSDPSPDPLRIPTLSDPDWDGHRGSAKAPVITALTQLISMNFNSILNATFNVSNVKNT